MALLEVQGSIYNKEHMSDVTEVRNINIIANHFRNIGKKTFKDFCQSCQIAEMELCQNRKNDRNGIIS